MAKVSKVCFATHSGSTVTFVTKTKLDFRITKREPLDISTGLQKKKIGISIVFFQFFFDNYGFDKVSFVVFKIRTDLTLKRDFIDGCGLK